MSTLDFAEIHWHEGLFLQPHHLQSMQRHLSDRMARVHRTLLSYPYGLIDLKISADALEDMRIVFDSLRLVMHNGIEVSVPGNADLPALDIRKAYASGSGPLTVYLGLPLWHRHRANSLDDHGGADPTIKRLFTVADSERVDENTGDNPQPVLTRRFNARLLLEGDDTSDLDVLPVLRIIHPAGDETGAPRLDPAFIPPCLVIAGYTRLYEMIRDLSNQVSASREALVNRLRPGFSLENLKGLQIEQMLRLRTLNRFAGLLPTLLKSPATTPLSAYLLLRELLGELAALHPDRDPFEAPSYNHDNLMLSFNELCTKIRSLLGGAVAPSYRQVAFAAEGENYLARLSEEDFTAPNDYFLCITCRQDPTALAKVVEDPARFKLMPLSIVDRLIFGVRLKEERYVPGELPTQAGMRYFRLLRTESQAMWDRIASEKVMAITARQLTEAAGSNEFKAALYMTVPG